MRKGDSANSLGKPFKLYTLFGELQPMIQQSQFLSLRLLQDLSNIFPHNHSPHEEEQKIFQSPTTAPEAAIISSTLSRKLKQKILPQTPKVRKAKRSEVVNPNQKSGHWQLEENKRYHWFLEIHNQHFLHKHMRRTDKIFKIMATFVGTRQAEQCRSHHQKMEKKHHTFARILLSLRNQHYLSYDEQLIMEDLQLNSIDIVDQVLLASYLVNFNEDNRDSAIWHPQAPRVETSSVLEEKEEEKVSKEMECPQEQLSLFPLNPQQKGMDIVDQLLAQQAPHNHYHMI